MRIFHYLLMLFTVTMVGCASKPDVKYIKYSDATYAATSSVDVLRMKPVEREFSELGELKIRVKKSTEENVILYLKEKAMAIGADAIVILGEQDDGAVAVPIGSGYGSPMYATVDRRYLIALAIRYVE